jgi:hypothetical protein
MSLNPNPNPVITAFTEEFHKQKRAADRALAQLPDADLFAKLSPRQNSISVILRHLAGNMRSRFTDFLTTDGEKPTRDRESEFHERPMPRADLLQDWESGWSALFTALAPLTDADLTRTITIRTEPLTVAAALARQLAHYGWHLGQIVLLAKHLRGEQWTYLTIPPGHSAAFNQSMTTPHPTPKPSPRP